MKNTFGQNITATLFGESHGDQIGVVLDGLAPGILVDEAFIAHQLTLRRPAGKISTARQETDDFRIVSGIFEGKTCGTPLCILIPNSRARSRDYSATRPLARPGHADYTAWCKYHGFEDYRGGGHFSGRITAALTAAGGILIPALARKGIEIGTHICALGGVADRSFRLKDAALLSADLKLLSEKNFPVLDAKAEETMRAAVSAAAEEGDSIGGVLESIITGIPAGVGEPWFDTVEGLLAQALFSIPAVKGVEFGAGFAGVQQRGSVFNDPFCMKDGRIETVTNHNGGVNGGITNGMPVLFRCAIKPTPSIYREQDTVNFFEKKNAKLNISGRHDPAIIHRARVVVDSMAALVTADLLTGRFGTDYLAEEERCSTD